MMAGVMALMLTTMVVGTTRSVTGRTTGRVVLVATRRAAVSLLVREAIKISSKGSFLSARCLAECLTPAPRSTKAFHGAVVSVSQTAVTGVKAEKRRWQSDTIAFVLGN
ncbi:hypothetical protein AB1E18_019587 [Capra hircus]